jgi:hypothetical protein
MIEAAAPRSGGRLAKACQLLLARGEYRDPLLGSGWPLVSPRGDGAEVIGLTYARRSPRPSTARRELHAEAVGDPRSDRARTTTGPMTRAAT